jgi:hypothetical protein
VDREEVCDDGGLGVLPQHELQHNGCLEHPRHRCRELRERTTPPCRSNIGGGIEADAVQAALRFIGRQALTMEWRIRPLSKIQFKIAWDVDHARHTGCRLEAKY